MQRRQQQQQQVLQGGHGAKGPPVKPWGAGTGSACRVCRTPAPAPAHPPRPTQAPKCGDAHTHSRPAWGPGQERKASPGGGICTHTRNEKKGQRQRIGFVPGRGGGPHAVLRPALRRPNSNSGGGFAVAVTVIRVVKSGADTNTTTTCSQHVKV